jgi:methyltransferase (TIGR00027 family)
MRILALLVFVPFQIAFVPLAIVGMLLQSYRQMIGSRRLGVSQTGIEVLGGRWTMHIFGMREDEATMKLARVLPNFSELGMWGVLFPSWVHARLVGKPLGYPRVTAPGSEDMRDLVTARTAYIDALMKRSLDDVEQVVLMGAGYDTRAYGEFRRDGLSFFELDQIPTQEVKKKALADAGIDTAGTRFVSVDFQKEDAFERLAASGYDDSKKTFFLWEGVTLYLGEEDVRRALQDMKDHSAPESVIVADFYSTRMIAIGKKKALKQTLEFTDEGLGFGIGFESDHEARLRSFIESEGLTLDSASFMGTISKNGPFMVVTDIRT